MNDVSFVMDRKGAKKDKKNDRCALWTADRNFRSGDFPNLPRNRRFAGELFGHGHFQVIQRAEIIAACFSANYNVTNRHWDRS